MTGKAMAPSCSIDCGTALLIFHGIDGSRARAQASGETHGMKRRYDPPRFIGHNVIPKVNWKPLSAILATFDLLNVTDLLSYRSGKAFA
ncbi:MAG: hypothetical protein R3282_04595 [Rhodothermales bacterium]|nr:hypothetical protein [Rhodothermales bacterium]